MVSLKSSLAISAILFVCSFAGQSKADESEEEKEELVTKIDFKPENCERVSKLHDNLSMHYTGTLTKTGVKFDSSHDRNQPFTFQLGVGQVIQGWEKGLLDMCVGEKRTLIVPSHLGYGSNGAGELIPPDASLTFEVELVKIEDGMSPQNIFKQIDVDSDDLLSKEEVSNFMKEQASKAGPDSGITEEQQGTLIDEIFKHEDKDEDGYISHEEFSGPKHDEL
nr:FK506-binding protein 2-like protein [Crepidula fornicata]